MKLKYSAIVLHYTTCKFMKGICNVFKIIMHFRCHIPLNSFIYVLVFLLKIYDEKWLQIDVAAILE